MKIRRFVETDIVTTFLSVVLMFCSLSGSCNKAFASLMDMTETKGELLTEARVGFEDCPQSEPTDHVLQDVRYRLELARTIKDRLVDAIRQTSQDMRAESLQAVLNDEQYIGQALPKLSADKSCPIPAERLFKMYIDQFTMPIDLADLPEDSRSATRQSCRMELKACVNEIMDSIGAGTVGMPNSSELYEYGVVLPALVSHCFPEDTAWQDLAADCVVDTDTGLYLSDFCCRRIGCAKMALEIAKRTSKLQQRSFSPADWAIGTAQRCHRPDLAEKCLLAAIDVLPEQAPEVIVLRLHIAEAYGQSGDHATAEQKCLEIAEEFPHSPLYGKSVYYRFQYLAKQSKFQEVLAEIDSALDQSACETYLPELMYMKWWALRQTDQKDAADKIGQQLVDAYGDKPLVAPVLLVQATDYLAEQRYTECRDLLTELLNKFPETGAAKKAQHLLEKLGKIEHTPR